MKSGTVLYKLNYYGNFKHESHHFVGHAVGRDAFVDHKMIVPLSELVRLKDKLTFVCVRNKLMFEILLVIDLFLSFLQNSV